MNATQQLNKTIKDKPSRIRLLVIELQKRGYDVDTVPRYFKRKLAERESDRYVSNVFRQ